jgi:hypothetical protein
MNTIKSFFKWILKFSRLYVLFSVCFVIGSMAVASVIPDSASTEPGLVSPTSGLLIIALADLLINLLLPLASVRLSHMIETTSSTFIFGALVIWLLHREHHSFSIKIALAGAPSAPTSLRGRQ